MKQFVAIGIQDYTVLVKIRDDAGAPATGLTEASIDIAYARVETDNDVTTTDVTPAALSALTDAHTDWGFEEVSSTDHPGLYRLDIADAVFASGAWSAVVTITGTGLDPCDMEFILVAFNPRDGVRLGLTALPNAAADAAGGLPISDAGGLDLDAKLANTHEVTAARMGALTDWINGGRLDLIIDAILADTNELQTDWVNGGRLDLLLDATLADTNELQTDWANGGRLDLLLDATLADTNELQGDWVNGGRLDLILDARASQTSVDTIDGNVDSILADTGTDGVVVATFTAAGKAEIQQEATDALNAYDPPTKAETDALLTTALTESYAADGSAPTLAQAVQMILQRLIDFSISGTTITVRKRDGSTTAFTLTLDDGTDPTDVTQS